MSETTHKKKHRSKLFDFIFCCLFCPVLPSANHPFSMFLSWLLWAKVFLGQFYCFCTFPSKLVVACNAMNMSHWCCKVPQEIPRVWIQSIFNSKSWLGGWNVACRKLVQSLVAKDSFCCMLNLRSDKRIEPNRILRCSNFALLMLFGWFWLCVRKGTPAWTQSVQTRDAGFSTKIRGKLVQSLVARDICAHARDAQVEPKAVSKHLDRVWDHWCVILWNVCLPHRRVNRNRSLDHPAIQGGWDDHVLTSAISMKMFKGNRLFAMFSSGLHHPYLSFYNILRIWRFLLCFVVSSLSSSGLERSPRRWFAAMFDTQLGWNPKS